MNVRRATVTATCLALVALPAEAAAGVIFGTLTGPTGPVAADLVLTCGQTAMPGHADGRGTYRITIAARGRCNLRVGTMPPPGELVFVYEEPTRYDYSVHTESGQTRIDRR